MKKYILTIAILSFLIQGCSMNNNQVKTSNKTLIHDIWFLKKINKKSFDKKSKDITIEFNTTKSMFYGNDSCNQIFGSIKKLSEDELILSNIAGTLMACPDMSIANKYINILGKVKFYKIKNLHLYLLNEKKEELLDYLKVD